MKKRVLVVAALILAIVALWLALRDAPATPPAAPAPAAAARPVDSDTTPRPTRVRVVETRAEPPPLARAAATEPDEPPTLLDEAKPARVLLVVESGTDRPLAGVRVGFLAGGAPSVPVRSALFKGDADPVDVVMERGQVVVTDAEGRVTLPEFEDKAIVAARQGHIEAALEIDRTEEPWRLVLRRTAPLAVLVQDSDGHPVAGVRVLLVIEHPKFGHVPIKGATSDTVHGAARFSDIGSAPEHDDARSVLASVPFAEPPSLSLGAGATPWQSLRLTLPPFGSVRCEVVDESGAPAPDGQPVLLRRVQPKPYLEINGEPGRYDDARATVANGAAMFPIVGLGLELEADLRSPDASRKTLTQTFSGPTKAGEEVVVKIPLGEPRLVFTGRLVDAKAAPVTKVELAAALLSREDGAEASSSNPCTTDESGRFRFAVDPPKEGATPGKLRIGRRVPLPFRDESISGWTMRPLALLDLPRSLSPGETDVGSVVFRATDLLVSGAVVDAAGTPLVGVRIRAIDDQTEFVEFHTADASATSDAQGEFTLEGDAAAFHRVRLGASREGYFLAEEIVLAPGTTGARLVMRAGGSIAGSVRLPEGKELLSVVVEGEPQRNGDIEYRGSGAGLITWVPGGGAFEVKSLRPGMARVRFRLGSNVESTVLTVEDVPVVAGKATTDPRLADVDLRGALHTFRVQAVGPDEKPVSDALLWSRAADSQDWWRCERMGADGTATASLLAHAKEKRLDLLVSAAGYRTASRRGVDTDTTVVLDKGKLTTVRVWLSGGAPLPEPPFHIGALLRWIEPGTADDAGSWGPTSHDPRDRHQAQSAFGNDRGLTHQTYTPGRYRVELTLRRSDADSGSETVVGVESIPRVVVVTVGEAGDPVEVVVGVDAESIRKQMADLDHR